MKHMHGNRNRGFTVVELMVVLVIVAILVALAYPSYIEYVRKSRRGEAQQLLMNWSVNQEIWRSNHSEYATVAELVAPTHDSYDFVLSNRSETSYTLTATAKGDQVNDLAKGDCTILVLNETGAKTPSVCWGGQSS